MSGSALPYVYGALGGIGILLVYRGFRVVADTSREDRARRAGLWMINGGIAAIAGSAALIMWAR